MNVLMNDIPVEVQLHIYDYFLSLRNYRRNEHHYYPILEQIDKNFDNCNEEFENAKSSRLSYLIKRNELFKNMPCSEPPILQDVESLPTQIYANFQVLKLYRKHLRNLRNLRILRNLEDYIEDDYLQTKIFPYKIIVDDSAIGHVNLILFMIRTRKLEFEGIYDGTTYEILHPIYSSKVVTTLQIENPADYEAEMDLWCSSRLDDCMKIFISKISQNVGNVFGDGPPTMQEFEQSKGHTRKSKRVKYWQLQQEISNANPNEMESKDEFDRIRPLFLELLKMKKDSKMLSSTQLKRKNVALAKSTDIESNREAKRSCTE